MSKKLKERVIPKDQAVFWLDKNGYWNNEHGKFQHPKIISHFHSCLKKDQHGYFLYQSNGNFAEKVYFPYEDTALFVFDVIKDKDITLVLNTKKQVKLATKDLFAKDDSLYMRLGDEIIKFAEHALMKISDLLEYKDDQYFIRINDKRFKIKKEEVKD